MKRKRSEIKYFELLPDEIIIHIISFICFPYCRLISKKFRDLFDDIIEKKQKYSILNHTLNLKKVKENKIYLRYNGIRLIQKNILTSYRKIYRKMHSLNIYTFNGEIFSNNQGYDQYRAEFDGKNINFINISNKYVTEMKKNLKDHHNKSCIYLLTYNNIEYKLLIPIPLLIDKIIIVSKNLIYYTILFNNILFIFMNENKLKNSFIYKYEFGKKIYKYHIYLSLNNKILNILILDEPNEKSYSNLSHISIIV